MEFISQLLEHPSLLAYFSGADNYTWLQFQNGERRLLAKPLIYFEERLPTFIRIHKTALINPTSVASIHHPSRAKAPGSVRMRDGAELPVSRRRWPDVVRLLEIQSEKASSVVAPLDERPDPEPSRYVPYVSPPLLILAVMTGDALLLTRERIHSFGMTFSLQQIERGEALATSLLLSPAQKRPALILLDARTNRADRVLTLRALKGHAQLRAIPVVWLAPPGEDTMQAYALDANSVVVVPDDSASFKQIIQQVCRYWLMVVQLPPETDAA